ncbi:MAG: nuclear transport factor 2 family protein [Panacagrimonas sp.]
MGAAAEVISGLYESFARGDLASVIGVLDPQISWREADGFPYAGTYVGPDAVRKGVFEKIMGEWSSYTTVPSELVEQGETVVGLGIYTGTFAATGKTFRAPFAHVWRVRGGKIVFFDQYTDTALVQQVLK